MIRYFILLIIISLIACQSSSPTKVETVEAYYQAFDDSDFNKIKSLIADSLVIVEGPYTTGYSHESFHEQFRWDSIFQSTYELKEIDQEDDHVLVTVSSSSPRYAFLKNDPLNSRFKISFEDEKIARIDLIEFIGADFAVWEKAREKLVSWIKENHPELDGFINDLSMRGALNYLKAIELYQAKDTK